MNLLIALLKNKVNKLRLQKSLKYTLREKKKKHFLVLHVFLTQPYNFSYENHCNISTNLRHLKKGEKEEELNTNPTELELCNLFYILLAAVSGGDALRIETTLLLQFYSQ